MKSSIVSEESSFRDPAGLVFYKDGKVYRQVNNYYKANFDLLNKSGLYKKLLKERLILSFKKVGKSLAISSDAYCVIEVPKIPFISYPHEWSFSQLKDAAAATLKIQKLALAHGMSLRDATAYNIQFIDTKPVLIDLLSFEKYKEGAPWVAYRQFCQHFLAPLALASYKDIRLTQLLKNYIDGIPLDLASKLLPKKTWFNLNLASHIHFHAKTQQRFASVGSDFKKYKTSLSRESLNTIIENLSSTIRSLKLNLNKTEWSHYYSFTNYSKSSFSAKKKIVEKYLKIIKPKTVWDLGANTGEFSRIASFGKIFTVSADSDVLAVEKNYLEAKEKNERNLLPLVVDLANPSPSSGWANKERKSLKERGPVDCILALALIHHLAISNNLPFEKIAKFFSEISKNLIIEFVPKEDSQVQHLLATREDIFAYYNIGSFEQAFSKYFKIIAQEKIAGSRRTLYCMIRK